MQSAYTERPDYFSGIGFVFAADDPYTGIDFDNCLDEHGAFTSDWAAYWVRRLNSYTEISPSGRGVKVMVRGTIPAAIKHQRVELYDRQRFFTITGNLLPGMPTAIRAAQGELDTLYAEERGSATPDGPTPTINNHALPNVKPLLGSDKIPRGLSAKSQGRRILVQALAGWPEGTPDYSLMRFIVVCSLVMHGYTDEQIAALLWYYEPALNGGNKNSHNWQCDIARMIGKARHRYPDVTPRTPTTADPAQPAEALQYPPPPAKASTARRDRPQKCWCSWVSYVATSAGRRPYRRGDEVGC